MRSICRFIVSHYEEAETIKMNGKIVFINLPFKRSLKIFSFPKWKFRKKKYAKKMKQYNIGCVDSVEYSLDNILLYLLLKKIEKYDCICFGFAGLDYSTIEKTKQFLLQLEHHVVSKLILIVVEENSIDEKGILAGFPIYDKGNASK